MLATSVEHFSTGDSILPSANKNNITNTILTDEPTRNFESYSNSYSSSDDFNKSYEDSSSDIDLIHDDSNKILWTSDSLKTLGNIMNTINNTKLVRPIGYNIRYYINKHSRDEPYKILTVDTPVEEISKDVMILAYICENRIKRYHNENTIIFDELIYRCFGRVLFEIIDEVYRYDEKELNYNETYMINMLNDTLPRGNTNKSRSIIMSCYFITKQIIKSEYNFGIIRYLETITLRADETDLGFLTSCQMRNIMEILETKRRIYLKFFMVLSDYFLRENSIVSHNWLYPKSELSSFKDLNIFFKDPVIEVLIVLTYVKLVENYIRR